MAHLSIAIVGASSDRSKYGNKAVRAYVAQGYDVYPVNPKARPIEGLTTYARVSDIPVSNLNRVSLYVPPAIGIGLLDQIAAKGCDELWLNPGSESDELIEHARQLGLEPVVACSIVDVGISPSSLN
jgi:uncharacterized protein